MGSGVLLTTKTCTGLLRCSRVKETYLEYPHLYRTKIRHSNILSLNGGGETFENKAIFD